METQQAQQHAGIVGEVVVASLERVRPNGWNPNVVPEHIQESIREDFRREGWIAAQALLVWGRDERGVERNLIIDGEHRWKLARQVGMTEGPMVFWDGLTEDQAKRWTIKLDQKRGAWDPHALAELVGSLAIEAGEVDLAAMDLGFSSEDMGALFQIGQGLEPGPAGDPSLAPVGPRELTEEAAREAAAKRKLEIVVECDDRERAIAVAEHCRKAGWRFREEFR